MFKYLVFINFLSWAAAATSGIMKERPFVPILIQGEEKTADGSFAYYYEGADGGQREETGHIKNPGTDEETLVVKGSYSYINANGEQVFVEYIADENGFQPQGTIIPKQISQAASIAATRSRVPIKEEE